MGNSTSIGARVVSVLIIILGIIHLAVGIGIVVRYRQYGDVFRQAIGVSSYNIFIGIFAIIVGIMGFIAISLRRVTLCRVVAIISAVLGVFALVSLIVAMVMGAQAINFIRGRLSYHISAYVEDQNSINIMDAAQTNFRCCGENFWLDWGRSQLGSTATTGTSGSNGRRRRRRQFYPYSSPLIDAVRKRRQIITGGTFLGLPSSYSVNLPLSCCKDSGVSSPNSLGGVCVISVSNSSNSFYVSGCMPAIANVVISQLAGFVLINTCLAILSFVFFVLIIRMFPDMFDPNLANNPNNPNNKQPLPNDMQQQQNQNVGYYYNNNDPNANYAYTLPQQTVYQ
ncbi:unnamed protein product [Rotaria sp. Silwood1]|nr:unnamed protein product [Rotaria sp. Silwood1]CAF1208811.1 unnamed protein product [Rotaria sp. Silwood1]CAF4595168.1 unnamed protein product [Rotaria sp. Silwood1]CAF5059085.1 unnamed protein product [Rotaria sp. Silwood1]